MYSFNKIFWMEESLIIDETHKEIRFEDIKEIKIKKKRKNGFFLFKYLHLDYKFSVRLSCDRIYEFYFHSNKLKKAMDFKYVIDTDKKLDLKQLSRKKQ